LNVSQNNIGALLATQYDRFGVGARDTNNVAAKTADDRRLVRGNNRFVFNDHNPTFETLREIRVGRSDECADIINVDLHDERNVLQAEVLYCAQQQCLA
jgi:hypothetical protein